jgi:hypothetical protein
MAVNPKIPTMDPHTIAAAQAALAGAPSNADAPGVDKIRELLFGNQMQDYDRRFSLLEERFQQKMRELEGESGRSLGNLESSIKKQLDSLAGQVRQEQDLRTEADKDLGRSLSVTRSRPCAMTDGAATTTCVPRWSGCSRSSGT